MREESRINSKVEVRDSQIGGMGMFAKEHIATHETVVEWRGDYTDKESAIKAQNEYKLIMQWDTNLYSIETRGDDEAYFINHSCDPNVWMDDAFTLVARREIKKGEELTADYALWEANENYISQWNCKCSSPLCRKKMTGKDWRLKELQAR